MKISNAGLDLIKSFEGLRKTAYRCPAGILTIGYGSTGRHVKPGMTITEAQAVALLDSDLDRFEHAVEQLASPCTQGQFDALVSFAFNCGIENLKISSILRDHKSKRFVDASNDFAKWNKARVDGMLKELPGLTRRRTAEAALYRS